MPAAQSIETRGGVAYASHDGVSLLGDLYLPAGAGPFPALVSAHGGGWQPGRGRAAFQFWGPYLAARGYALFAISYRVAKKGQNMFPQAVTDVLGRAVRARQRRPNQGRSRAHRLVGRVRRRAPRCAGGARGRKP